MFHDLQVMQSSSERSEPSKNLLQKQVPPLMIYSSEQPYTDLKANSAQQTEAKEDGKEREKPQQNENFTTKPFTFYSYGGNYPETIARALVKRGNWQEGREEDCIEKCNLVWRPFNFNAEGYKRMDKRAVRNN